MNFWGGIYDKKLFSILMAFCLCTLLFVCGSASTATVEEPEVLSVDAQASVVNLKTDRMENPVVLDDLTPSFSWQME